MILTPAICGDLRSERGSDELGELLFDNRVDLLVQQLDLQCRLDVDL